HAGRSPGVRRRPGQGAGEAERGHPGAARGTARATRRRMRLAIATVAAALVASPRAASADRPAAIVDAIPGGGAAGDGIDGLILVGRSGEIYRPRDGGWSRDGAGG